MIITVTRSSLADLELQRLHIVGAHGPAQLHARRSADEYLNLISMLDVHSCRNTLLTTYGEQCVTVQQRGLEKKNTSGDSFTQFMEMNDADVCMLDAW